MLNEIRKRCLKNIGKLSHIFDVIKLMSSLQEIV